jgi:hypothetical protein
MCEASAAAVVAGGGVLVADDESNTIRRYGFIAGEKPDEIPLPLSGSNVADIEGAASLGDRIYWIGSHSRRNRDGASRPARQVFVETAWRNGRLEGPAGTHPVSLLDPIRASLAPLGLDNAVGGRADDLSLNPDNGGLNIEGLAAAADRNSLIIGLRAPLTRLGHAIAIPLINPTEATRGETVLLGNAVSLDLGGRGIRSMEWLPKRRRYLVVAGPPGGGWNAPYPFALYSWAGPGSERPALLHASAERLAALAPDHAFVFTPEALVIVDEPSLGPVRIRLLSDDGDDKMEGDIECQKRAKVDQRFRSVVLDLVID